MAVICSDCLSIKTPPEISLRWAFKWGFKLRRLPFIDELTFWLSHKLGGLFFKTGELVFDQFTEIDTI